MKKLLFLFFVPVFLFLSAAAQPSGCTFKKPVVTIHFGAGKNVRDINESTLSNYERLATSCPPDGYYTYTPFTNDCFSGDWHTLPKDHTPGDADGNIMLVNASRRSGVFFSTTMNGLKSGATYEFSVWMMNVCRISDKCPFPLLPTISFRLQTPAGETVAQFGTGELARLAVPRWTQYRGLFAMPPAGTTLMVTMQDNTPGGCGNDFALDDITIRECVKPTPSVTGRKKVAPVVKQPTASKPVVKKVAPKPAIVQKTARINRVEPAAKTPSIENNPVVKQKPVVLPPPPAILVARANPLVKQIETEAGEIRIDLYDNGEIDGDTVSIYHNNELLVSKAKLSQKPISFRITVDAAHPHHELVMVANNLGSIPPNTSLMIVTAQNKKLQVFILSTEQKNAKVVIDLKE